MSGPDIVDHRKGGGLVGFDDSEPMSAPSNGARPPRTGAMRPSGARPTGRLRFSDLTIGSQWAEIEGRAAKRALNPKNQYYPTGVPSLDIMMSGGIPRGGITMVIAPPGAGKTSFMVAVGRDIAQCHRPVLFVSLEMSADQLWAMGVSAELGKPRLDVLRGKHNADLAQARQALTGIPLAVATTATIEAIEALILDCAAEHGDTPLVIIDYVQLLANIEKTQDQRIASEQLSRHLSALAREQDVAMVLISSTARANYRFDASEPKRGQSIGLAKESGQYEFDALIVIGMFQARDEGRFKLLWLHLDKNRIAEGTGAVAVKYDGLRCSFTEIDPDEMPGASGASDTDAAIDERIRVAVGKHQLTTRTAIADAITGRRTRRFERARILEVEGRLVKEGGTYRWVE
jgi:replicative DNA helicase